MEGFRIGSKETSLETVVYDHSEFSLLGFGDGAEVVLQTIDRGKLFYVYPSDHQETFEFYYIVSGELQCEYKNRKEILGPNQYFSAKGLKENVNFKVLSDVTLLTVSTEQTFFHLSEEMSYLQTAVKQVEDKDRYTYNHAERVANYSFKIGSKLNLERSRLRKLLDAASLHDVGKINVPQEILIKPGKLTNEEYDIIKKHPADGADMIKGTYYEELAPIILQHHERLNGSGYPSGLKGDEILLEARIIAVSDTFDAMTEDRAYRKAFDAQFAMNELKRLSGTHYDAEVVQAFEEILKEEGMFNADQKSED